MRSILLTALGLLATTQALAQGTGDPIAGRQLVQTWCAGCHAIDRAATTGTDNVPSMPAIAARPAVTADGLRAFLAEPHGRMPNLSLSRREIDDAIAHILSLRQP